ncbi:MAG: hypothetical protein F6J93_25080 [Oscillatoria sp. SIO1A7]|nr:hypothetical protein [Oscillatoria sp. SIO1A7]
MTFECMTFDSIAPPVSRSPMPNSQCEHAQFPIIMMSSFTIKNEVPWPPERRMGIQRKFSEVLMFEGSVNRRRSSWVTDPKLASNIKQLLLRNPGWSEKAWLHYFLEILRDESQPDSERDRARQHLVAYYQESTFWVARSVWIHWINSPQQSESLPSWEWDDLFDRGLSPLQEVQEASKLLQNFDPDIAAKQYLKKIQYRNLKHWLEKKRRQDLPIAPFTSEEAAGLLEPTEFSDRELSVRRDYQDRAYSVLSGEMKRIEAAADPHRDSANIWTLSLLNYGLELKQPNTAALLGENQIQINQATVSRKLTDLRIKLMLKVLAEFLEEAQENLELDKKTLEERQNIESDRQFVAWAKKQQSEVVDFLKEYCIGYLSSAAIDLVEQQPAKEYDSESRQSLLKKCLDSWLQRNLLISILGNLPPKIQKKINAWVEKWAVQVRKKKGGQRKSFQF